MRGSHEQSLLEAGAAGPSGKVERFTQPMTQVRIGLSSKLLRAIFFLAARSSTRIVVGWSELALPFCKRQTAAKPGMSRDCPTQLTCDLILRRSLMRVWVGRWAAAAQFIARSMVDAVGILKSQVFMPTYSMSNSLMLSKGGPSAVKALFYIPTMAVCIGPASEAGHLTHWSASFLPIIRMVGQWVLAVRSLRMVAGKRQGYDGRYRNQIEYRVESRSGGLPGHLNPPIPGSI